MGGNWFAAKAMVHSVEVTNIGMPAKKPIKKRSTAAVRPDDEDWTIDSHGCYLKPGARGQALEIIWNSSTIFYANPGHPFPCFLIVVDKKLLMNANGAKKSHEIMLSTDP